MRSLTPLMAVRRFCRECVGMEISAIPKCSCGPEGKGYRCSLWPFRMGHKPKGAGNRLKAIVRHCRQCCGVDTKWTWRKEVEDCSGTRGFGVLKECPLVRFRMGRIGHRNPTSWLSRRRTGGKFASTVQH